MESDETAVVSIIVPVYNTQKYLTKCLLSILSQTYAELEIILVDDRSTDRSKKICEKFAEKDKRIKLVTSVKSGVSEARNLGISISSGKYLCFVDSDDWLPRDSIKKMVSRMCEDAAELCYGNYEMINILCNEKRVLPYDGTKLELKDKARLAWILQYMGLGPCWKLYQREIIELNQLQFPNDMSLGEDQIFNLQYLMKCHRIAFERDNVYFYNRLNLSSATKRMHPEIAQWSARILDAYRQLFADALDNPDVQQFLRRRQVAFCYNACNHYLTFEKQMSENEANTKIEETIAMFSVSISQGVGSEKDGTYAKWKLMKDYVDDGSLTEFKRALKEKNYECNLAVWKKPILAAIRSLKTAYIFQITLRSFDYST